MLSKFSGSYSCAMLSSMIPFAGPCLRVQKACSWPKRVLKVGTSAAGLTFPTYNRMWILQPHLTYEENLAARRNYGQSGTGLHVFAECSRVADSRHFARR